MKTVNISELNWTVDADVDETADVPETARAMRIIADHPTRPGCRFTIAEVYGFTGKTTAATARLMANAPKMLKALKLILHNARPGRQLSTDEADLRVIANQARAIIEEIES